MDLARAPVLALYDPNKETKVAADAPSCGLGGVVLQLQPDKSWRPISFLSRALTPTESGYAQIEKEALVLTCACERSWEYITGKSIYVETDHKPLVPLLGMHSLDQLPPRIQRFRMRLMRFHFKEISHVPGKKMYIADALSRLQPQHADSQPTIADDEMTAHVASVITGLPASDMRLQQIIEAQEEDPVCRQIKTYCSEGWPDKHSVNDAMKPYWSTRGELTVVQNILLKGTRIVIPQSNGEVECGVRTVKNLLQKAEDPAKGLLAYRSTPLARKFSPTQLLIGRKLRNSMPMFHTELNPHWPDLEKLQARESESKRRVPGLARLQLVSTGGGPGGEQTHGHGLTQAHKYRALVS